MKRKEKKRIVVELIVLIILYCVNYYIYKGKILPVIGDLPSPIKFIGFISVMLLLLTGKDITDRIKEWYKPTLPQSISDKATFEVTNIQELLEVASRYPFLEKPLETKTKEKKTWCDVEKEIYFSNHIKPIDLSTSHKVFFIIGKQDAGKSTYMLWSLGKYLQERSWPFKKVFFLNPTTPDQWALDLKEYDPEETLLVIDALYRRSGLDTDSDTNDEDFKSRWSSLFKLAFANIITIEDGGDERDIGPFKILATIRDDEYEYIKQLVPEKSRKAYFQKHKIIPEFRVILERYLEVCNVPYYKKDLDEELIEQLKLQSIESVSYIRNVAESLKEEKKRFSKDTLMQFPPGTANFIWDTIVKSYYLENDDVIPFLLLLLLKTDKYFSEYLLRFVGKTLGQKGTKGKVLKRIEILIKKYLCPDETKTLFTLQSDWKISLLREGLEQSDEISHDYYDIISSYRRIRDEDFNRLCENISEKLKEHLQEGFKDNADILLCIDLAKLKLPESEESLEIATDIYIKHSSKLPPDIREYVQGELYKLWVSSAWKYRAKYNDEKVIKKVIACYENAFDRLGVRNDPKQLHAYACYLLERILPNCDYGTTEWQECKEKIEKLYNEVIELKLDDPISYQALALFYAEVEEEKKAEKTFEDALKVGPTHIPTMQAYAIFLKDRGKRTYNYREAKDYYERAEKQFIKAIETLNSQKINLSIKEFVEFEKRLLNACASFLIDKTEWIREKDERKKIDAQVDKIFEVDLLKKYSNHGHSITKYSRFLMDFAWILDKYNDWEEGERKNLRKARLLLENFISNEEKKPEQELSYFMSLHILALYYYRQKYNTRKYPFEKYRQHLQKAEECLKKSSTSFSDRHNSIAYNELGRLYTQWARVIRRINQCDYENKMSSAKAAYEEAISVAPKNRQFSFHLSSVYFNYAFYFQRMDDAAQAEKCIHRALDVVKGFVPTSSYYSLTNLGTEFLRDEDLDIAERVFIEAKKLKSGRVNPSYALCKLGDIYAQKKDVKEAVKHYLLSARSENTSEGYGTRRHSIKQLINVCKIRPGNAYYNKCIRGRIICSKKAYQLEPNFYKNCGDYGEDLLQVGQYHEALPVLQKGLELLSNDEKIEPIEKRRSHNIVFRIMGDCYRCMGDDTKAEEYYDKGVEVENFAISWSRNVKQMYELKIHDKVIDAFQKFVEKYPFVLEDEKEENIFPYLAGILNNVGTSYEKLSIEDKSILAWKDYADVYFYANFENPAHIYGIVGNKLKQKKPLVARECFIKSFRIDPTIAKNLGQLGEIDESLNKYQEGTLCYKLALDLDKATESCWKEYHNRKYQLLKQKYVDSSTFYSSDRIEDLIDQAIMEELESQPEKAFGYYKNALILLNKQEPTDKDKDKDKDLYRFIADAFWSMGDANNSLELYKKIKDRFEGYQKIVIEAIIWFISRKLAES